MKQNTAKNTGWGGARVGAGRKSAPLSQSQVRKLLRRVQKDAKKRGKHYHEVLIEIIHGPEERSADKISAIKHLDDLLIPRIQEGGEADKALGPVLFLPEHRPPQLDVINGGKKDGAA